MAINGGTTLRFNDQARIEVARPGVTPDLDRLEALLSEWVQGVSGA